ncbi:MAG: DUF3858 domain-containing protein [Spirochaetes bacterium]|nr:DUF3858 domain-containing protein [Spirochaetota bacterium]
MNKRTAMTHGESGRRRLAGMALAGLLALAFLCDPSAVTGKVSPEQLEKNIMKSLATGNWPDSCAYLESLLTNYPLHPLARLHYGRLADLAGFHGIERVERIIVKMKKVIQDRVAHERGACLLALNILLEDLLYLHDREKAKGITGELNPVREWALAGPFHRHGIEDMDHPFMPEMVAGSSGKVRAKQIHVDAYDGWLRPGRYLLPSHGIAYARTLFVPGGQARIHVYCKGDYRVFINGRKAGGNVPGQRRSHRIFGVRNARQIDLMLKLRLTNRDAGVRVIVTDEKNAVIDARPGVEESRQEEAEVFEENDFPFDRFLEDSLRDRAPAFARIGIWLDGLGSDEAIEYYQKSIEEKDDDFISYRLAVSLIKSERDDDHFEGWRIIGGILNSRPGFMPAGLLRLKRLIDDGEYRKAFRESKRLSGIAPGSPALRLEMARLLDITGHDSGFQENVSQLKREYPESIHVAESEVEYLRKRDRTKYLLALRDLLRKAWTPWRGRAVARELLSCGDYRAVGELFGRYNFNNDLSREAVEAAIRSGDFDGARTMIFKEIIQSDDPWFYEALYRIDTAMNEDPSMYLQKLLSMDPSRFDLEDFIRYLDSGSVEPPPETFLDDGAVDAAIKRDGHYPSSILYRGRTFLLQDDGSSRAFCEDIVRLTGDEGRRRCREMLRRFPVGGIPVRIRIYGEKGGARDFRGNLHEGELEGFLAGFPDENAVIHIAYIQENPVPVPEGGRIFSYPPEYLQGYDEPAGRVSIRVITPEEMTVYFSFRDKRIVNSSVKDGMRRYAVMIDGLEAVERELHSGHDDTILSYYSFSTMKGPEEYAGWHRWDAIHSGLSGTWDAGSFRKKDLESTVAAVYGFAARGVDCPGCGGEDRIRIQNAFPRRTMSQGDRVRLARAILDILGIKSFPAFTRNRFRSPMRGYMFHEYFTDTLLFVPIDRHHSIWLDFSDPCVPCGMTSDGVDGADAEVMVGASFQRKRVASRGRSGVRSRYLVHFAEDGNARCRGKFSFFGAHGTQRSAFHNQREAETRIWDYMEKSFPAFTLEKFRVRNLENCAEPFILEAEGAFQGPTLAGGGMMIRPVVGVSSLHDYARYPRRNNHLVIEQPVDEVVSCTWELPESLRGAVIASSRTIRAPFGTATVEIQKRGGEHTLEVTKSVQVKAGLIEPDGYPEFLQFCRALRRIENETILLN